MRRKSDAGGRQETGRASKVGDGLDPDGCARCMHFLVVVKSETWRTGHESGHRWCGRILTVSRSTASCLPIFSGTEAGRKSGGHKSQGVDRGVYRVLDRGHSARCSRRRLKTSSEG